MAFYLKYRPQKINDLDLENVRDNLSRIIKSDNIPHAFLFAGPKGTGKTSAARILAKVVNCLSPTSDAEPCNKCEQCLAIKSGNNIDVVEMDAASHRGIDDIRSLRDAVKLAPASSKKKVYIIDEAHMLTKEASNALLKTLEEPPEHVIFILATTNPEKLIPTIRSRTTLVSFSKATREELVSSLKKKLKGEKVTADDDALDEIAELADGSFRDADKILEQLSQIDKKITIDTLKKGSLTTLDFDEKELVNMLFKKEVIKALSLVNKAVQKGGDINHMMDKTIVILREMLIEDLKNDGVESAIHRSELVYLIKLLIDAKKDVAYSYIAQIPFEIAIVSWCQGLKNSSEDSGTEKRHVKKESESIQKNESAASGFVKEESLTQTGKSDPNKGSENGEEKTLGDTIKSEVWKEILVKIREMNASTEALLRASRPLSFHKSKMTLGVYYKFHKEHLESMSHRSILEEVCGEILGQKVSVNCVLVEPETAEITVAQKVDGEIESGSEKSNTNGSVVLGNMATIDPANTNGNVGSSGHLSDNLVSAVINGNGNSVNGVLASTEGALTDGKDLDIIKAAEEIFSE